MTQPVNDQAAANEASPEALLAEAIRAHATQVEVIDGYQRSLAGGEWYRRGWQLSDEGKQHLAELIADHLRGAPQPTLHIITPDDDDEFSGQVEVRIEVANHPLQEGVGGFLLHLNDEQLGSYYDLKPILLPPLPPGAHYLRAVLIGADGQEAGITDQRHFVVIAPEQD